VTWNDPGKGDPGYFTAEAARLRTLAADYATAATQYTSLAADIGVHWTGAAGAAAQQGVSALVTEFTVFQEWLEADAATFDKYAGDLQAMKDRQATLHSQRVSVADQIDSVSYRLRSAENVLSNYTGGDLPVATIHEQQAKVSGFRQQLTALQQSQDAIERHWADLVDARTEKDRRFVFDLGANMPGHLLPPGGLSEPYTYDPFEEKIEIGEFAYAMYTMTPVQRELWLLEHPDVAEQIELTPEEVVIVEGVLGGPSPFDMLTDAIQQNQQLQEQVIQNLKGGGGGGAAEVIGGAALAAGVSKKLKKPPVAVPTMVPPEDGPIPSPSIPTPSTPPSALTPEQQELLDQQQEAMDQLTDHLKDLDDMAHEVIQNLE